MATHVRQYEALFLFNPNLGGANFEQAKTEVEHILGRAKAEVLLIKKWEERKLAYEIAGQKRGLYVLAFFKAEGTKIAGVERDAQLSENILRIIVLKADHLALKDMEAMQPQVPAPEEDRRDRRREPSEDIGIDIDVTEISAKE
jgi:small subunit ribosomal protein S6